MADTRPLLSSPAKESSPKANYGATEVPVTTSSSSTTLADSQIEPTSSQPLSSDDQEEELIKKDPPKVSRPLKEIFSLVIGLWLSVFCAALSATIVANLQVEMASYFKSGQLASWISGGYLLGVTAFTPLWGRLSNVFGRRAAILSSLGLFTAGTVLCAVAPNFYFLITARIIAGCGGGGCLTVTAIIVSDLVSLQDRGLYQGFVNLLFGAGSATGALVGGWVFDSYGWRAAFHMQIVPIVVSASLIIWKVHVPMPKSDLTAWQKLKRIDWLGLILIITSVTTLMISMSLHTASGFPVSHWAVWSLLVACVISTVGFCLVESYLAAEPIIPITLLTQRTPALVLLAFVVLTMTNFARLFELPIYLHVVRGYNGRDTGYILLPSSLVGSASSLFAGWYMSKTGKYKRFTIAMTILPLVSSICVMRWTLTTNAYRLAFEMSIAAWGGGAVITTFLTALIASVSQEHMSLAVSASYLFRSIGQVIGVSITAAIQQLVLGHALEKRFGETAPHLIPGLIKEPTTIIPTLSPALMEQAKLAYLISIDGVFIAASIMGLMLTVCAVGMKAYSLPGR